MIKSRIIRYSIYYFVILAFIYFFFITVINYSFKNEDMTKLPHGSRMNIKTIYLPGEKNYLDMPLLSRFGDITKVDIGYGFKVDTWHEQFYKCRIEFSKPVKEIDLPKGTLIVFGRCKRELEPDGMVVYYVEVLSPKEISRIVCSSYVEHYIGYLGEICHIPEKTSKTMSIKEFNRCMVLGYNMKY
jgi:hypothetical protein